MMDKQYIAKVENNTLDSFEFHLLNIVSLNSSNQTLI